MQPFVVMMALAASWSAATPTGGEAASGPGPMHAVRTLSPIHLDGKLDEPAWKTAPVFTDFVQSFPSEGSAPDERTEVRVLYDGGHLYVGVICFDHLPSTIQRQAGRRDTTPTADQVLISIDSSRSHRNGYLFSVNAAGVLRDSLLFGDVNAEDSWDAVWDAAVADRPDGWSAEFDIPLKVLRYSDAPVQTWGFLVQRELPRLHETLTSVLIPRNANGRVSRFGQLTGMEGLKPRTDLELTPYVATRLSIAPKFSDPAYPHPRLLNPSGDVGLDLRASLTSALTLNAAVNPDFGQVEADQVILNLQNFEAFFPEKRPFFNQGLDLFTPVGAEFGAPHQLFYSRRIGLDSPILAATKVTGSVKDGFEIGVLDAVVTGANNTALGPTYYSGANLEADRLHAAEQNTDRRLQFHPETPFHLGLNNTLPPERPVTTNYFAAVAREQVLGNSTVGLTFTSAAPLGSRCSAGDFPPPLPPGTPPDPALTPYSADVCRASGGNAAGFDWNLKTRDGVWGFLGIVDGSEHTGDSASGTLLNDGTVLHGGDLGLGGYARVGKFGGEPWRFYVAYQYASPKLDLNDVGYLPSQNQQKVGTKLAFVRPNGIGSLRAVNAFVSTESYFTTDGSGRSRGNYLHANANVQLAGFQTVGLGANLDVPNYDVREIKQAGIPFQRASDINVFVYANSDPNRAFYLEGDLFGARLLAEGVSRPATGFGFDALAIWRPASRLETQLLASLSQSPQGPRYVDNPAPNLYIFAPQSPGYLSLTLRQQLVLTPKLTLQAYAQLFSDYAHYGTFYRPANLGAVVKLSDLVPTTYGSNPDFHDTTLNLNVVLRWEYRLGSTFFAVYTRSQQGLPAVASASPPANVYPFQLGRGAATDTFLLKWSYFWDA